jgi:hypothetical protein
MRLSFKKFPLGRIVVTDAAKKWITPEQIDRAFARHAAGDWGDVCSETARDNDAGTHRGHTLVSIYGRGGASYHVCTFGDPPTTTLSMVWDWSSPRADGPETRSDGD